MSYNNISKVAFVGPKKIHEAFATMDDTWDLQIPLETIYDFNNEISSDRSRISSDTSLIIYFSRLYNSNKGDFAETIANLAPHVVNCILIPSSDRYLEKEIRNEILKAQSDLATLDEEYNIKAPFYFVSYENAQSEIFDAIYDYANSPDVSKAAITAARAMLPDDNIPEIEESDNYDDYITEGVKDEIVLPEKDTTDGIVVSVTSSKGGSGKSTVTLLLASYIARASLAQSKKGERNRPMKVCVVDMDVRDGQLGFLNGTMEPNVASIAEAGEPNIENILKGVYSNKRSGVDFIFATKRPKNARQISPHFYAEMIGNLRKMYDIVLLDTSVNYLDPLLDEVAYPMSDKIIFVTDFVISSIFGMVRWSKENINVPKINSNSKPIEARNVKIVLNKSLEGVDMEIAQIEEAAGEIEVIAALPNTPLLITRFANQGIIDLVAEKDVYNAIFKDIATTITGNDFESISNTEYNETKFIR